MATITFASDSRPFEATEATQPLIGDVGAIADADDLVIPTRPAAMSVTVIAAPGALTTSLNSLSDGSFPGQRLTLIVDVATNTLRVPAALGNVGNAADLDVTQDNPACLVWNGTVWLTASK